MSISSVVTRGFSGGIKFIPTRGFLSSSPVSSNQSGVRRLVISKLQSYEDHPQVVWERSRRQDEEEMLMSLLAQMLDYFDD